MLVLVLSLSTLITGVLSQQWSFYGARYVQCYSCSDCPEPFFYFPTQITVTPLDVGQCMKTVVTIPGSNRLLVSKGFTRTCIAESSNNVRVFCCQNNLCNGTGVLRRSISLLSTVFFLSLVIRFA